jgi:hypothetical protein
MLTTTGFAEDCWAIVAPKMQGNSTAAQARIFMSVLGLKIERTDGNLKTSSLL